MRTAARDVGQGSSWYPVGALTWLPGAGGRDGCQPRTWRADGVSRLPRRAWHRTRGSAGPADRAGGRRVARVALTRESLVPEVTVTADGVYWHPVAATDERALVTRTVEPLTPALDMVSRLFAEQWTRAAEEAALFPCA